MEHGEFMVKPDITGSVTYIYIYSFEMRYNGLIFYFHSWMILKFMWSLWVTFFLIINALDFINFRFYSVSSCCSFCFYFADFSSSCQKLYKNTPPSILLHWFWIHIFLSYNAKTEIYLLYSYRERYTAYVQTIQYSMQVSTCILCTSIYEPPVVLYTQYFCM